jgi:hypothetical protein
MEKASSKFAPLAYMRGRTLNNAFIILDEAQNSTAEQMFMFLTRLGTARKAVITGDPTQIDLPAAQASPASVESVTRACARRRASPSSEFTRKDVVRHPLVQRIIAAYEEHRQLTEAGPSNEPRPLVPQPPAHSRTRPFPCSAAITRYVLEEELRREGLRAGLSFRGTGRNGSREPAIPSARRFHGRDHVRPCGRRRSGPARGNLHLRRRRAVQQAREFDTTWQEEVARYIIHSLLHLRGHDDLEPAKRRRDEARRRTDW